MRHHPNSYSLNKSKSRGHITYKETNLFYSDADNSESAKQDVAEVIAHELAHFWFGNLVTCKWWDEIWLNEAMVYLSIEMLKLLFVYNIFFLKAEFLQGKAINSLYPEWDLVSR